MHPDLPLPYEPHEHQDGPTHWSDPVYNLNRPRWPVPATALVHDSAANTRLIRGVQHYNLKAVEQALREGANPNVRSYTDGPLLFVALKPPHGQHGWDPRLVRALLEAGADPSITDSQGHSVALMAWQYSHNAPGALAVTRWLIHHPWTDVTLANRRGSCMIGLGFYAPSLLEDLVRRGEDPNRSCHCGQEGTTTALGASLRFGVMDEDATVRAFAQAGADPNACPPDGDPALAFLIRTQRHPSLRTVQALLDIGADPDWTGPSGATLDDFLRARSPALTEIDDALMMARHRRDNQRLRLEWRDTLPEGPSRPRNRL